MNPNNLNRNENLDIVKGSLVFIMLFYHCASVSNFPALRMVMSQIHFIHYAFLLITGFLCGYHYYAIAQAKILKVQHRLVVRAWKIFAVFLCANIFFYYLGYGHEGWNRILTLPDKGALVWELLTNVPGDLVAFEILYLISAFLVLAAILMRFGYIKWLLFMIGLANFFVPGTTMLFISFGCIGMLTGILARESRLSFIVSWIDRSLWVFPVLLILKLALSFSSDGWDVDKGLRVFLILFETMIWFFSFVWGVNRIGNEWFKNQVILFGQYTLPAYILQMICARIVYLMLSRSGLQAFLYYVLSILLVTVLTWSAIIAIDRIRKNWRLGDRIYCLVFQ